MSHGKRTERWTKVIASHYRWHQAPCRQPTLNESPEWALNKRSKCAPMFLTNGRSAESERMRSVPEMTGVGICDKQIQMTTNEIKQLAVGLTIKWPLLSGSHIEPHHCLDSSAPSHWCLRIGVSPSHLLFALLRIESVRWHAVAQWPKWHWPSARLYSVFDSEFLVNRVHSMVHNWKKALNSRSQANQKSASGPSLLKSDNCLHNSIHIMWITFWLVCNA